MELTGAEINGIFGNMRFERIAQFDDCPLGTHLPIPNLANVAREFGAYAERVEQPEHIIPSVQRALESGRPALLEFMVDTSVANLRLPRSVES